MDLNTKKRKKMNEKTKIFNIKNIFYSLIKSILFVAIIFFISISGDDKIVAKESSFLVGEDSNGEEIKEKDEIKNKNNEEFSFKNGIIIKAKKNSSFVFDKITKQEIIINLKKGELIVNNKCALARLTVKTNQIKVYGTFSSFVVNSDEKKTTIYSVQNFQWIELIDKNKKKIRAFAIFENQKANIKQGDIADITSKTPDFKLKEKFEIEKINNKDIIEKIKIDCESECLEKDLKFEFELEKEREFALKKEFEENSFFKKTFTFKKKTSDEKIAKENYINFTKIFLDKIQAPTIIKKTKDFLDNNKDKENDEIANLKRIIYITKNYSIFSKKTDEKQIRNQIFYLNEKDSNMIKTFIFAKTMDEIIIKLDENKNEAYKIIEDATHESVKELEKIKDKKQILEKIEIWQNFLEDPKMLKIYDSEKIINIEDNFENLILQVIEEENQDYDLRINFARRKINLLEKVLEEIFKKKDLEKLVYAKKLLLSYKNLNIDEINENEEIIEINIKTKEINKKLNFLSSCLGNKKKISEENMEIFLDKQRAKNNVPKLFEAKGINIDELNAESVSNEIDLLRITNAEITIKDKNNNERKVYFDCEFEIKTLKCSKFKITDYRSIKEINEELEFEELITEFEKVLTD